MHTLRVNQRVTLLKKPFFSISPSAESYFEVFWGSPLFESFCPSYEILDRCFLVYPDSQCTKKNFTTLILLLGGLCNIFGPILGILLNILRNVKHFLDILHECLDITVVVTKLRNGLPLLGSPSALSIFGYFWSIFYYFSKIVGNHLTFLSEYLFIFIFWLLFYGGSDNITDVCLSVYLSISVCPYGNHLKFPSEFFFIFFFRLLFYGGFDSIPDVCLSAYLSVRNFGIFLRNESLVFFWFFAPW